MKKYLLSILILLALAVTAVVVYALMPKSESTPAPAPVPVVIEDFGNALEKADLIQLESPRPNETVQSPLVVTGRARGNWFFEASFPIVVVDWDGRIIGQGIAQAQGEWMTTEFVPFEATVTFTADPQAYSTRGALILQKDNPSGISAYDDALEIPVTIGTETSIE